MKKCKYFLFMNSAVRRQINEQVFQNHPCLCFNYDSFMEVWHSERVEEWRKVLLDNRRACPMYELGDGSSGQVYNSSLSCETG